MALSRNELKSVIKELLVEILNEGLGNAQSLAPSSRAPIGEARRRLAPPNAKRAFDHRLDTPLGNRAPKVSATMQETIKRESGGNPIMADIFKDTALTTLPTMQSHGDNGSAAGLGSVLQEQFNGNPEDVFGEEASSRWANLAFATPKKPA